MSHVTAPKVVPLFHRHPSPPIAIYCQQPRRRSPSIAIDRHWSPSIATGRHPSPTAVREPRSHPASLARGFDLPLHATRPARTMFAATSAAGVMLQRTRLVSSEPLVVNVSSNGAFLDEDSRDRCACSRLAVPAYRLLDSKSAGWTIPTLRPTRSTKSRGLQCCATHTLQSHSIHTRLPRSQLRPQKKPYVNVPPLHLHTGDASH